MTWILVVLVLAALLSVWFVPKWQLSTHAKDLALSERLDLVNEYRRTVAQIVAGVVVLIGLYFTWQQLAATQATLELNRRAAMNERFTKAIEQLASKETSIRIGGIFALQQLAYDNTETRMPILQVLSGFLMESARRTSGSSAIERPPADVLAAIATLSDVPRGRTTLSLRGVDLRHAPLSGTNFENMDLTEAHFENAVLGGVTFVGASLYSSRFGAARLENARFDSATLAGADLKYARLQRSSMVRADLRGADLTSADLTGADLRGAIVNEACFAKSIVKGTHVEGTDFTGALGLLPKDLEAAITDSGTRPPEAFSECRRN